MKDSAIQPGVTYERATFAPTPRDQLAAKILENKEDALVIIDAVSRLVTMPGFWDGEPEGSPGEKTPKRIPIDFNNQAPRRNPLGGHLFCFRGRSGNLLKVIWHDECLFSKRLERGRFLWPSPADGRDYDLTGTAWLPVAGIDWRNPQETWRPTSFG